MTSTAAANSYAVVAEPELAARYDLPLNTEAQVQQYAFWLQRINGQVSLCQNIDATLKPLSLDFAKGKYAYRLKQVKSQKEPLGKACGLAKSARPTVIDATAGLAQDGLLLAAMGSKVILVEQHPLIHALLADALARAASGPDWLTAIIARVELVHARSEQWLSEHSAEVVYLDPMYPEQGHDKRAKVKKGMQLLRLLPETVTDHKRLFESALSACHNRLVVKRPNWAEPLTHQAPTSTYPIKTHHYDIYFANTQA